MKISWQNKRTQYTCCDGTHVQVGMSLQHYILFTRQNLYTVNINLYDEELWESRARNFIDPEGQSRETLMERSIKRRLVVLHAFQRHVCNKTINNIDIQELIRFYNVIYHMSLTANFLFKNHHNDIRIAIRFMEPKIISFIHRVIFEDFTQENMDLVLSINCHVRLLPLVLETVPVDQILRRYKELYDATRGLGRRRRQLVFNIQRYLCSPDVLSHLVQTIPDEIPVRFFYLKEQWEMNQIFDDQHIPNLIQIYNRAFDIIDNAEQQRTPIHYHDQKVFESLRIRIKIRHIYVSMIAEEFHNTPFPEILYRVRDYAVIREEIINEFYRNQGLDNDDE